MISTIEKLKEVLREISYREFVYPRLIAKGTLTESAAKHRIAIMKEIADELSKQLKRELLI